jgi:glycosyltransferase involved in cell wall biosynthesis
MRIVAVLVVRNERPYLGNCLSHLIDNGLDFVIVDNDSSDGTAALLRQEPFARHMVGYQHVPYAGVFDWAGLLQAREAAARAVEADWVLFVSADEIMHSYVAGETLAAAITRIDAAGYEVIDFNEFVFLPIDGDYVVDAPGPQPLRYHYFFEPSRPRLMRARKRSLAVSHQDSGGHVLSGAPFRLAPETFALRHYIFRDQAHAFRKYAERVFPREEVAIGWHINRVDQPVARFTLPPASLLDCLASPEDRDLSHANPRPRHFWQW